MTPHIGDVIDGWIAPPGIHGSVLPFPSGRVASRAGTKFVGTKPLQLLALAEKNTEVRPEELVAGACQKITVNGADSIGPCGA